MPIILAPLYFGFGLIYLMVSVPLTSYYVFICYKLLKSKRSSLEKKISKKILHIQFFTFL